ncbi:Uncharacterised protein [Actinomyces naeslundii]|nr:Uncharacterised protein [Actinomyces naeslundii]
MRAAHPLSPHAFSTLRRLTALTAVMTLTLTMVSCSIGESNGDPVISSLNAQEADAAKPQDSISDMDNQPLSTASGLVTMSTSYVAGGTGSTAKEMASTVASRERSTDKFQWAVSIKPAVADRERTKYADNAQSAMSENMDRSSTGSAVVSPDGRYLSLILLPSEQQSGETAADLRTHIVVLDTKTGKTVRDATVSGVILGQALTNSALAVETAQNYFPAGSGKGTITIFYLTDTSAQPSSFPTDKWLVGATRENLMLAPEPFSDNCSYGCSMMTVTLINADGSTAGSISGVTAVHPGGWIHRVADPKSDEQQLVNPSIKKTIDITGKRTFERGVPTGPGLLVEQEVPTGNGSRERKPAFWLSSSDDGHPHTENLEQFTDE